MTKTTKTVYVTSDKQEFGSEAEAQAHEINQLTPNDIASDRLGKWLVDNRDTILSILGAKRRTRSDKGKSRKAKEVKVTA